MSDSMFLFEVTCGGDDNYICSSFVKACWRACSASRKTGSAASIHYRPRGDFKLPKRLIASVSPANPRMVDVVQEELEYICEHE